MIRQTSLLSYESIVGDDLKLTESYKEILSLLNNSFALTDNEMAKELGYADPNKIRPRRNELMKGRFLMEVGKRPDRHTKKTSIIWDITEKGKKILTLISDGKEKQS